MPRTAPVLCSALAAAALAAAPVSAGISQQFFLSDNNTLYFVVSASASGGDFGSQVTSIVIGDGTAVPVNETAGADMILTSFAALLTGGIINPPLGNIRRTGVITGLASNVIQNMGNPLNGVFDPSANGGNGLLTLPGGTMTVSFGSAGTEPDVPVTQSTGAGTSFVGAAATTTVTRRVGMTTFTSPTIVFPNPAGAVVTSAGSACVGGSNAGTACDPDNPPPDTCQGGGMCTNLGGPVAGQNVTLDSTVGQRVGNPASQVGIADGIFLRNTTSLIVFVVQSGGASAFGISADGFAVTGTCSNADQPCMVNGDCPSGGTCTDGVTRRNVLNSAGDVDNSSFRPARPPSPSPSPSPGPNRPAPVSSPIGLLLLVVALGIGAALALVERTRRI